MRRFGLFTVSALLALGVALWLDPAAAGQEGRPLGGEHRLFYVFSLDDLNHRLHARRLEFWGRAYGARLQVLGIARADGEEEVERFRRRRGLSYAMLSAARAQGRADLPPQVVEHLGGPADYALLLDARGQRLAAGKGAQLESILALLGAPPAVPTYVEEGTWGKIKDLFR